MENATKALLMAAGILVGILILVLMATLFISSRSLFKSYDETKNAEAIQQFNANFTKYVGKDLTIHEVVTISNFASKNGVTVENSKSASNISSIVSAYNHIYIKTYRMSITDWENGYVKKIKIIG